MKTLHLVIITAGIISGGIILAMIVTLPQDINQVETNKKLIATTNNLNFVKLFLAKYPQANIVVSHNAFPNSVVYSYSDPSISHTIELLIPVKVPDYFPEEDWITLRCVASSQPNFTTTTVEFPTDSDISLATAITVSNCVKSNTNLSEGPFKLKVKTYVASLENELNPTNVVKVDQTYSVTAEVSLLNDSSSSLIYYVLLIQITDQNGNGISTSWSYGKMLPNESSSYGGIYWIPNSTGTYTIEAFAWASLTGTPLAESSQSSVHVIK